MPDVRRWGLALVTLLVLALVLAYFAGAFHAKVADRPADELHIDGELMQTQLSEVPVLAPIPGTVRATDETVVASRILANVVRVHVRAGDKVALGAPLVDLDDVGLRSVLQQREQAAASAKAQLDEAVLNRDRAVGLYERRSLSRADYDRALTNFRIAEAEASRADRAVEEARAQVGYTRITAPMDGTVVDRQIEPGDTAMPGQAVLKLFNPGRLRVEAIMRESLIRYVAPGDSLQASIDSLDATVSAVVEEIVPAADPGSRTFTIKALLPPLANLYPGMFARLQVPTGARPALLVPMAAVHRSGQLDFVYVSGEHGPLRRFVRLGERFDGGIEVVSGLEPGTELIVPRG